MARVTIYWRDNDIAPVVKSGVEFANLPVEYQLTESDAEYTLIPKAGVLYVDVEL